MSKLSEAKALAAEAERLRSMVHTDVGEYDRDDRPGAVLLGLDGRVICTRVEPLTASDPGWSASAPTTRALGYADQSIEAQRARLNG